MSAPFYPPPLPVSGLDWGTLAGPIGRANRRLARYDGLLDGPINADILLAPLSSQEALSSSRIEGTQATLEEVLEHEGAEDNEPENKDVIEVANYRAALRRAIELLPTWGIAPPLIRMMHEVLMANVRGADRRPGEFRDDQVWIGPSNAPIEQATYVPPEAIHLPGLLENWEQYINTDDIDPIVQTAIMHAQFELIHPFFDGNGRIGRLLIPLYLHSRGVLTRPAFYLSAYLEEHREQYIASLGRISSHGDWQGWISFFLEAVTNQAESNDEKVRAIIAYYEELKTADALRRTTFQVQAMDALFELGAFNVNRFIDASGIPGPSARAILRNLRDGGIVETLREGSGRRAAVLWMPALFRIAIQ